MRGTAQLDIFRKHASAKSGLIVDIFAGGGGASTGLEESLGRPVDIALNHDKIALATHKLNHPYTEHLVADVWTVEPRKATGGRRVDVLWGSPDCTQFSAAKGGKPRKQGIRSLAWAIARWAAAVKPRLIFLENVREFLKWGPLHKACSCPGSREWLRQKVVSLAEYKARKRARSLDDFEHRKGCLYNTPIKEREGEIFDRFVRKLRGLGYAVEWRVLDASQYGAPTKRLRLFLVARRDGLPIVWPAPTHGKGPGLKPFRTAAECIDWSIPCPSIFGRKKPLAKKTQWRIAEGIKRFVIDNPEPFLVEVNHGKHDPRVRRVGEPLPTITASRRSTAVVAPILARTAHGDVDRKGKRRGRGSQSVTEPTPTVTGSNDSAVVAAMLVQQGYGERKGQRARTLEIQAPLGTIVAQGTKHAVVEVEAYLAAHITKHFGGQVGRKADAPMSTVTARDHQALTAATLVKLNGECHGASPGEPMPTVTAAGMHIGEVRAFLTTYYGSDGSAGKGQRVDAPLRTITSKARLGLVLVKGVPYQIVDIGMRMLEPEELLRAQFGRFARDYDLSAATTKERKVRLIGNSVPPELAEAVVRANCAPRAAGVAA